jgi:hypothetical protein
LKIIKINLDSNIETANECKKQLLENSLENKKKDNEEGGSILEWKYWGLAAGVISIIALVFAAGK